MAAMLEREEWKAFSDFLALAASAVCFMVGDLIAWQLAYPVLNLDLPWTNFGRLRPAHTSAVIFAVGDNALISTSFYVAQRTSCAKLAGHRSPWFVFWGYQLFLVLAATGYILGVTQSKEYAERARWSISRRSTRPAPIRGEA